MEWLCIQEHWNSEVVIIFGTAARYRQATVGRSHDDANPDNSTLHTEAVRPRSALSKASSSYRPVRAIVRKCSKRCQLFRSFREHSLFVRVGEASIFFSEPIFGQSFASCLDGRIAVREECESHPDTRRSLLSLNDYPFFCFTLDTAGGVGELY
jgi:hypothetical protein